MPETDTSGSGMHHGPATFWAVDLHVHTPASADVQSDKYGASTAEEIVNAALAAGLDAIAVTDHNTVAWCQKVVDAAAGRGLTVLPGVEISTDEGHLLAIWDEGTPTEHIEDVLVGLGIPRASQGGVELNAKGGFADTARKVAEAGGLAIAAHADREKGLLKLVVRSHMKDTLLDPAIAAIELVDPDGPAKVAALLGGERVIACVRGSDSIQTGDSWHSAAGIGSRRVWIKASRPDLRGLRHAFDDPDLRVRLGESPPPSHMIIRSVRVGSGFLAGLNIDFSPDLNCLVGGTGVGKSLLIEIIRFALGSQPSRTDFATVRKDVDSRLDNALGANCPVELVVERGGATYTVRRVYAGQNSPTPEVISTDSGADLNDGIIPIRAFSQGEVIEYARTPVGRMVLIDTALDLSDLADEETVAIGELSTNGVEVAALRSEIKRIEEHLTTAPEIAKQLQELTAFFREEVVAEQEKWSREKTRIGKVDQTAEAQTTPTLPKPRAPRNAIENEKNSDLYQRAEAAYEALNATIDQVNASLSAAYGAFRGELTAVSTEWNVRHQEFDQKLSEELTKVDTAGKGLAALRKRLQELQAAKAGLDEEDARMRDTLVPGLATAIQTRETLINRLVGLRRERRDRRRARIAALNRLMFGIVRIKLDPEAGDSDYLQELVAFAKGSNLRKEFLTELSQKAMPVRLVRSYLDDDADGVAKALDLEVRQIEKLFDHVKERGLEREFLDLQAIDIPDALTVEFRKSETDTYEAIERLAHGQKCTAILIIALADGNEPLIIDQPEDALHAPWIEDYLVSKLRQLRGSRQYIFATRSPGLVVSADAEMIVTMTAGADRGRVESSGSLERHDLNALALYHLEGGPEPFKRRMTKMRPSIESKLSTARPQIPSARAAG